MAVPPAVPVCLRLSSMPLAVSASGISHPELTRKNYRTSSFFFDTSKFELEEPSCHCSVNQAGSYGTGLAGTAAPPSPGTRARRTIVPAVDSCCQWQHHCQWN